MRTVCCVCGMIKGEEGWVPLTEEARGVRLSHGYCPACYTSAIAEFSRKFAASGQDLRFPEPESRAAAMGGGRLQK